MALTTNEHFGHAALHDLDPEFCSFSRSEKVAAVLQSLNIRRPLPVQSMYIFKVRLCSVGFSTHAATCQAISPGFDAGNAHGALPRPGPAEIAWHSLLFRWMGTFSQ